MYRVLIVDDEVMILKGLRRIINWEKYGFTIVAVVDSGPKALAYLADHPVDLVITDVSMPKMNGLDFVHAAFARGDDFLFLILSGYDEFDYAKKSLQLGALNYLMKPIDRDELIQTLAEVKTRLDEQQEELPRSLLLNKALTGQLSSKQQQLFVQACAIAEGQSYYLVTFVHLDADQALQQYLIRHGQDWFVDIDQHLFLFKIATRVQIDRFLVSLPERYRAQTQLIVLSASASDLTALPTRFSSVQKCIQLTKFYEQKTGLIRLDEVVSQSPQSFPKLDIGKIDRLINENDQQGLRRSIRDLFTAIAADRIDADYVRQISFWLFATLNRRLHFSGVYYNHQLALINQLNQFSELLDLNLSWINQLQKIPVKNYSANVMAAVQYIYLHYRQDINLSSAAHHLHLNSMYLGQLFKQETSETFNRYLNHYRIEQSRYLLHNTTYSVSEIGLAVGYSTPSYFFRIFKQIMGCSPKEYREQK